MARPIDANALIQGLKNNRLRILLENENDGAAVFDDIVNFIDYAPTLNPPNEPLTIEQLREMDGEPAYIHSDIFPEDCGWRVIAQSDVLRVYFTDGTSLSLTDCGKSWLSYRRPPEGEEDT